MISELAQLGRNAGALRVGDDDLGAGVLDRPHGGRDVPVSRDQYRNVVGPTFREPNEIQNDQRVHALLVLLRTKGEVALPSLRIR